MYLNALKVFPRNFHAVVVKENYWRSRAAGKDFFGPNQVKLVTSAEQGENRVSPEGEVEQGNY